MKQIVADKELVASCGLYCGACGAYRRGRCRGCRAGPRFASCPVRKCCNENGYVTCADCKQFPDPRGCKKFNNCISKLFGLIFRSNRRACIMQIRQYGLRGHAELMAAVGRPCLRR